MPDAEVWRELRRTRYRRSSQNSIPLGTWVNNGIKNGRGWPSRGALLEYRWRRPHRLLRGRSVRGRLVGRDGLVRVAGRCARLLLGSLTVRRIPSWVLLCRLPITGPLARPGILGRGSRVLLRGLAGFGSYGAATGPPLRSERGIGTLFPTGGCGLSRVLDSARLGGGNDGLLAAPQDRRARSHSTPRSCPSAVVVGRAFVPHPA
jgi:hypothetical protein